GRVNAARAVAPPPMCASPSATASPASPASTGVIATFQATASCNAAATAEYRWMIAPPGAGWTLARDWNSNPSFGWNTAGLPGGAYQLDLAVRAAGTAGGQGETVLS